jgi:hypothetical protein
MEGGQLHQWLGTLRDLLEEDLLSLIKAAGAITSGRDDPG